MVVQNTTFQIMENEILHFVIGEGIPKEELERLRKQDGQIVRLGSAALMGAYGSWQEYNKEADEPFAGWLVREFANPQTSSDLTLDAAERLIEWDRELGDETEPEIFERAEDVAYGIAANPEYTADSLSLESLAKLIGSITIKHSEEQLDRYREWEFHASGDPNDPEFLQKTIEKLMAEISDSEDDALSYFAATPGSFSNDGEFSDPPIEEPGGPPLDDSEEARMYTNRYLFDNVILPRLLEESTTIHAAQQLKTEAERYAFKLTELQPS